LGRSELNESGNLFEVRIFYLVFWMEKRILGFLTYKVNFMGSKPTSKVLDGKCDSGLIGAFLAFTSPTSVRAWRTLLSKSNKA
jgi:hypothetical protein